MMPPTITSAAGSVEMVGQRNYYGVAPIIIDASYGLIPAVSTAKPEMLLWPRLPTYKKRPEGVR